MPRKSENRTTEQIYSDIKKKLERLSNFGNSLSLAEITVSIGTLKSVKLDVSHIIKILENERDSMIISLDNNKKNHTIRLKEKK